MERELALEKLRELLDEKKEVTERRYKEILKREQKQLVEELLEAVLKLKKYYPIRVLQFQVMRTDLYQQKYRIEVCGYNKNWYLDTQRTTSYVDITYLFQPFQRLKELLEEESYRFMGAVSSYDINNLVNEFFITCFYRSATQIREDFFLFDEWLAQNQRTYRKPYRVLWGEYRGKTDILYLQDELGKESKDFTKVCESDKKEGNQFVCFVQSNLKDIKVEKENFAYLNMKKSNMQEVAFDNCQFGESMFQESVMDWCSYEDSIFYGCNFSRIEGYQISFLNANIMNSSFVGMKLRKGNFEGAKLTAVDFSESNLAECNFRNATLSMVDLRAEHLEGIDLTDAKLEEVYIHEKDMERLQLSEKQKAHVYILK